MNYWSTRVTKYRNIKVNPRIIYHCKKLSVERFCSKRSQLVTNHGCMAMTLKPKKTNHPSRKRFAMVEEIKDKSKQGLLAIPKSAFQKYFEDWENAEISGLYLTVGGEGLLWRRTM